MSRAIKNAHHYVPSSDESRREHEEDAALMKAMCRGDEAALSEVMRRHQAMVERRAFAVLRDRQVAEDVAQDVFLRLWHRAWSFDPSRGPLRGLLATMARNASLDKVRAAGHRPTTPMSAIHGADPDSTGEFLERWETGATWSSSLPTVDPVIEAEAEVEREALARAITKLPAAPQMAMRLRLDGLSHSEVAEALGCPIGTVKAWNRRALARLQRDSALLMLRVPMDVA